jgi:hypothetical protein
METRMSRRVLAGGAVAAGLVIVLVIALRGGDDARPADNVAQVAYVKNAAPTSNGVPAVQPYWLKNKAAPTGDDGAQAQGETPRPELPQTADSEKLKQALHANHGTRDLLKPNPTPVPQHKSHQQALEQQANQQPGGKPLPTADERNSIKRSARKQQQSQADQHVPGANVMRETLLKSQCTAPDAQQKYQALGTVAEKQAFAKRCASFGFHPQG